MLSSTAAHAQTAASAQAQNGASTNAGQVGEIIVTAQRRAERLQDVPIAVSAMSADDLATRQVNSMLDLVNYVPNLIGHNNTSVGTANAYALRGLANTESISTFDPPVGTYVDDIYISRQGANNFSFFDVERVEVLRGPQGTLFGRNTTGGAVNVILKKPSDEVTGYLDAGYGRYNRVQLRGSVDLPINSSILTKISGYYVNADGYVDNLTTGQKLNGEKSWGLRGAVRALISPDVTWDVSADYVSSSVANFPNFKDGDKRISFTPLRTDTPIGSDLVSEQLADNELGNTADSYSISSNFEVRLDNATINFITGYRHLYQEYMTDSFAGVSSSSLVLDGLEYVSSSRGTSTPLVNDSWHKQFSQEIKITGSAFNGFLDYVGGFYYINETNKSNFANISLPVSGPASVSGDRVMSNDTEAYAGYVQGDFHITDKLTFTAGIRYTDEHKTIGFKPNDNPLPRSSAINQPFDTQDLIDAGIPVELNAKKWTPRFALQYEFTPDLNIFASATRGFKSGGWNARAYYAEGAVAFYPETIWSYEGGIRSEWFDRKLRVNLTGFYFMDYDQQLPGGGLNPLTNTITYLTRNVADLENYGLEAEITVRPTRGLNIYWSFGLQHAQYKNPNQATLDQIDNCLNGVTVNNCNAGIVTPDGQIATPTRAPDFTSTLGASYEAELGGGFTLTPSVNWRYTSETWVSTSNDVRGYQKGYSLFNGGITLKSDSGWSIGAECSNCFDKTYRTSYLIYPYLNAPGTWMVRARYDF
ncbi:hypothetical protein MB02_10395 [Croceicoccus estronivorus]|nr:hypothetical protein MB02_10395 [Croceicoccus estronivorus]